MFKVLHVAIYIDGGRGNNEAKLHSLGFFGAKNCSTVAQARDLFIKKFRKEYAADRERGEGETPSEAIYKFPFRNDLVGYYHFEDGLSFVFPEGHPVYKLVQSKNYKDDDLAEKLYDLFLDHDRVRWEKQRKQAA
jgi:hypothetical protein